MSSDLFFQPITELSALLDARKISAVELLQAVAARTKSLEPRLHAFNSCDETDALALRARVLSRRAIQSLIAAQDVVVPD